MGSELSNSGLSTPPSYATAHVNRAASFLRSESAAQVVGPYRIVELLGQGGMGEVYKAQQESPVHRIVALKLIKLGMDNREVIRRFELERETLAMMSHPNVARMFDAGLSESGRPYFVMEYVPGAPITAYCDQKQFTIRQRLELFIQVCEAVQHAHTKTIIHRDLKPANMLVAEEDGQARVKVIDFGIAKATAGSVSAASDVTQIGQILGTPQYMSPEQAEPANTSIDTRSDVYSLGMVLYELLAGTLPFDTSTWASSSYEQIRKVIREIDAPRPSTRLSSLGDSAVEVARFRRVPLSSLRRDLSRELDWIPLKALRKDPSQRYRTAAEMADDIRNYLAERPLLAGPESRTYRLRKLLRRNRGAVLAAAAILLVLIGGMFTTGWMYLRSEHQRGLAERNQLRAETEAAKQAAVNRFLMEVLGAGNPGRLTASDRAKGRQTTVLEALRQAAGKVEGGSLSREPAVEAAVRISIGNTYKALGEYEEAIPHLERAIQLSRAACGEVTPEHASCLHLLGMLMFARGQLSDAESLCRQALRIRQELYGSTPQRAMAQSLNDLSNILQEQSRYAEAESMQRRAIEVCQALYGEESVEVAAGLLNVGYMLHVQGKLDEAEMPTRRALEMHRKLRGDVHPDVATALNNLASLHRSRGQLEQAEALYRHALDIDRELFGPEHPNVATGLNHLAGLALRRGNLAEAESLARHSLDLRHRLLGERHPDVAWSLENLGRALWAQQKFEEGESLFRQALVIMRLSVGPQHPSVSILLLNFARNLHAQSRPQEAETLLREALPIVEQRLPPTHPRRAEVAGLLGEVLAEQGKFAEAEPLLLSSQQMTESNPATSVATRAESLRRLIKLYESMGKPEQARQWRDRQPTTSASPSK